MLWSQLWGKVPWLRGVSWAPGVGNRKQSRPNRGSELPRATFTHTAVLSRGAQPWGPEVEEDKKEEMLEKGNDSYGT